MEIFKLHADIKNEAALFHFGEYMFQIFGTVYCNTHPSAVQELETLFHYKSIFFVPLLPDIDAPYLNLKSLWINPGV
jgi:hypothetical protein